MKKLREIITIFEEFASPDLAKFDYVGLLQGDFDQPIKKIGLTLDYSLQAIEQAVLAQCDLLITHHGPTELYYPLVGNNLDKIAVAARHKLAVYRGHLNLDFCEGGIIDTLCHLLQIPAQKTHLVYQGHSVYGGVNMTDDYPMTLIELKRRIEKMGIHTVRVAGTYRDDFSRIAITSGAGFFDEFMDQLKPDIYIAGEFEQEATKYAEDLGIMLVELGHHTSEARALEKIVPNFVRLFDLPVTFIEIPDTIQFISTKETI